MSVLSKFLRRKGLLSDKPGFTRPKLLARIKPDNKVLEIGPFTNPLVRGSNVRYFDVLNKDDLIARAAEHKYNADAPVDIDYVSKTGDLSIIDDTFDFVLSSHCIEHQPDLIRHLQHVERLLKPGGQYFLIVPDKRYCFDHFMKPSTTDDVVAAYNDKRKIHTLESHRLHITRTTHNDAYRHWHGDHGMPAGDQAFTSELEKQFTSSIQSDQYADTHAWYFTPDSFAEIIKRLIKMNMINLHAPAIYVTQKNNLEFGVVLKK